MKFPILIFAGVIIAASMNTVANGDDSKTIGIGTDVATLLVFHPDSLAHHSDDPIAWYAAPFAVAKDLTAGALVGFSTGSDGAYNVRMTTGALTKAEEKFARCSVDFRLKVEHGWVALDNSSGLPGEEQQEDRKRFPALQFKLNNGNYKVKVVGIDWHKDPEGVGPNGLSNDKSLPSYVMTFREVDDLSEILVQSCLPDLRAEKPAYSSSANSGVEVLLPPPLVLEEAETYPLLTTELTLNLPNRIIPIELERAEAERLNLLLNPTEPKETDLSSPKDRTTAFARLRARRARFDKIYARRFVIANRDVDGDVAAFCKVTSMGTGNNDSVRLGFSVRGLVKLKNISKEKGTTVCQATAFNRKPADNPELCKSLQDAFAQYAQATPIKAADYYAGLVRQQPTLGHTIWAVLDHFEVTAERFRELAVADETKLARMLIVDIQDAMKE